MTCRLASITFAENGDPSLNYEVCVPDGRMPSEDEIRRMYEQQADDARAVMRAFMPGETATLSVGPVLVKRGLTEERYELERNHLYKQGSVDFNCFASKQ